MGGGGGAGGEVAFDSCGVECFVEVTIRTKGVSFGKRWCWRRDWEYEKREVW